MLFCSLSNWKWNVLAGDKMSKNVLELKKMHRIVVFSGFCEYNVQSREVSRFIYYPSLFLAHGAWNKIILKFVSYYCYFKMEYF